MNNKRRRTVRRPAWDAEGITVELDSDRGIWCYDYHVSSAYHLLEGEPIARINRDCLKFAPEDAKRLFFDGSIHLLEPELRHTKMPADPFQKIVDPDSPCDGEVIQHYPPVRVIGHFKSTAMDQYEYFSYLILIWWQDVFDRVPDEGALARLKALDWESKAKDYSF